MKPAKDMKKTARYKHMVANLKSVAPYEKEVALLKEIAGGKQWRMDAVLETIQPVEWNYMDRMSVFEQAATFGRLSTIQRMSANEYFQFEKRKGKSAAQQEVLAAFNKAVIQGHYKVADYCISLGAHPDYRADRMRGLYAMKWAIDEADVQKIDYLVAKGADASYWIRATSNQKAIVHLKKYLPQQQGPSAPKS